MTEHSHDYGRGVLADLAPIGRELRALIPGVYDGFGSMHAAAFADGAVDQKTKELLALAIAIAVRCDGCIAFHAAEAKKLGVTSEEVAEALGVAINMNAGAAMVYSTHVLDAFDKS